MSWKTLRADPSQRHADLHPFGAQRLQVDQVGILDVKAILDRLD